MAARNAIAQRLDRLHDQWVEFSTAPEPRLLHWLVRQDEYRMVEAFLQKESDDVAGELPDIFLRFDEPFQDVNQYGAALLDGLIAQYAVVREELAADGIAAEWQPAAAAPGTHSLTAFITAATSLHGHYADELEQLAVVLTPSAVADPLQWKRWLIAAARSTPPAVRLVVVDDADAPILEGLAGEGEALVAAVPADLAMPEAMVELARAGGTAGPDGQFRVNFATLGQALGKGDLAGAEQAAGRAIAIAQENGWTHLIAAVHFAMGSGMLSAGRPLDAVERYRQVDAAGAQLEGGANTQVEGAGEEMGSRLRMQAAFAAGAAFIAAAAWDEGARVYQGVVPLTEKLGEPLMTLDAWRMAAYCREQKQDVEGAWACGHQALNAAESIPPEQRPTSMLPYAGDALLRLAGSSRAHADAVQRRMVELTGTAAWRPAPGASA
jgi:hypothetical protein